MSIMSKMPYIRIEANPFFGLVYKQEMTRQQQKITIHFWWFSLAPAPDNWYTVYPLCAGKFSLQLTSLRKAKVTFDNPCGLVTGQIVNGGHVPAFNVDNSKGSAKLSGGPLECDEYTLQQFHFRFGRENSRGSEHTVNNKSYAAQELHNSIHFLHVLTSKSIFKKRLFNAWQGHFVNFNSCFYFLVYYLAFIFLFPAPFSVL